MDGHAGARSFEGATPISADAIPSPSPGRAIGVVLEIAGSSSQVMFEAAALNALANHKDVAIAHAGQVGSQVKLRVGATWLIANVRALKLIDGTDKIAAQVDFLGEGDEEKLTGRIHNFRRGVTRYPVPGSEVFAATK